MIQPAYKNDIDFTEVLRKITIDFLLERPFFGGVMSRLDLFGDCSVTTACTNGKEIRFNPDWFDSLGYYAKMGLMAHEILHIVFKHHTRRKGRNPFKWNRACDMAINPLVLDAGFMLPEGALLDDHNPPRSAEEIYDSLPDLPEDNCHSWGEVEDSPEKDIEKEENRVTLMAADALRRCCGKISSGLERSVRSLLEKTIPWESILRNYITTTTKQNYSSNKFSKRFIRDNIYLPTLHSKKLELVLAIDTSGSVDDELLSKMVGVLEEIRSEFPTHVKVFSCDCEIKKVQEFDEEDPLKIELAGGGGTDYRPVFNELERTGEEPNVMVYLTDGECESYPNKQKVNFPVIWVYMRKEITFEVW